MCYVHNQWYDISCATLYMPHAHCMLDTQGYKHTLSISNTYCFSTSTKVARTCLHVTLYVNCLSC